MPIASVSAASLALGTIRPSSRSRPETRRPARSPAVDSPIGVAATGTVYVFEQRAVLQRQVRGHHLRDARDRPRLVGVPLRQDAAVAAVGDHVARERDVGWRCRPGRRHGAAPTRSSAMIAIGRRTPRRLSDGLPRFPPPGVATPRRRILPGVARSPVGALGATGAWLRRAGRIMASNQRLLFFPIAFQVGGRPAGAAGDARVARHRDVRRLRARRRRRRPAGRRPARRLVHLDRRRSSSIAVTFARRASCSQAWLSGRVHPLDRRRRAALVAGRRHVRACSPSCTSSRASRSSA